MYTTTVKIAESGTPLSSGGVSRVGHMWVTISDGTTAYSYGWHPNDPTRQGLIETGIVSRMDDSYYVGGATSSHTFVIDRDAYARAKLRRSGMKVPTVGTEGP